MSPRRVNLALLYVKGEGVPKDDAQAAAWYRKAADQGDVAAQSNLGLLYAKGKGVAQDYAEAAKWYRKAADQGDLAAQINLALLYAKGQGVYAGLCAKRPNGIARRRIKAMCGAQEQSGADVSDGQGVTRDDARSGTMVSQSRRARRSRGAKQSRPTLCQRPGRKAGLCGSGEVVRQGGRARRSLCAEQPGAPLRQGPRGEAGLCRGGGWYRKAAEQGNSFAQSNLGFLYANGQGVRQDYVQAYKWFSLAASGSTTPEYRDNAGKNRDIIADRMTPEQIKEAQRLAAEWKPNKAP